MSDSFSKSEIWLLVNEKQPQVQSNNQQIKKGNQILRSHKDFLSVRNYASPAADYCSISQVSTYIIALASLDTNISDSM